MDSGFELIQDGTKGCNVNPTRLQSFRGLLGHKFYAEPPTMPLEPASVFRGITDEVCGIFLALSILVHH